MSIDDGWHYPCLTMTPDKAMLDSPELNIRRCFPKIPNRRNSSNKLLWLWIAAILALGACRSQPEASLPSELIGTWIADHPKYATLYFQISPDNFSVATAQGTVDVYTLEKYERVESIVRRRKTVTHVLHGKHPDRATKFSLSYNPAGGGTIRLVNQKNITWTRQNGLPK